MRRLVCAMGLTVVALCAATAEAQIVPVAPNPDDRALRGMYGRDSRDLDRSLVFSVDFGGGYQTHVYTTSALGADTGLSQTIRTPSSSLAGGSAALSFFMSGKRGALEISNVAQFAYYRALDPHPWVAGDSLVATASLQLARHTSLVASQAVSYQPAYSFPAISLTVSGPPGDVASGVAPQDVVPAVVPQAPGLQLEPHVGLITTVGLNQQVSKRITAHAEAGYSSMASASGALDVWTDTEGAGAEIALGKGAGAHLGFSESRGHYPDSKEPLVSRNIDVGLGFSRSLSLTRRTYLSFSTGFAGIGTLTAANGVGASTYSLVGAVGLTREIGRSWSANVVAGRQAQFIETFRQPAFVDGVTGGLGGLISRRFSLGINGGAARGVAGINTSRNSFRTYFAGAGLTAAISRSVTAGLQYAYFRYFFGGGILLPTGIPSQSDNQLVQAYIGFRMPLWAHAKN